MDRNEMVSEKFKNILDLELAAQTAVLARNVYVAVHDRPADAVGDRLTKLDKEASSATDALFEAITDLTLEELREYGDFRAQAWMV